MPGPLSCLATMRSAVVARLAGHVGDVDVLVLVVLELAVAPAPAAVAGDLEPVVEVVEVVLPDQVADLGVGGPAGGEQERDDDQELSA